MEMNTLYTFCAIFGCAFVFLQFFLLLVFGVGGDSEVGDTTSMEMDSCPGGDFETDTSGAEVDTDASSQISGVNQHNFSAIDFLKMLSLRTITAGLAFFGLAGLAANAAELTDASSFTIALLCGLIAVVAVYFLYRFISSFRYSGSIQEGSQVGCIGIAHIKIPSQRSGCGRVIISQQERSMEYEAFTDSETEIKAGTPIIVVKILNSTQVLVEKNNS